MEGDVLNTRRFHLPTTPPPWPGGCVRLTVDLVSVPGLTVSLPALSARRRAPALPLRVYLFLRTHYHHHYTPTFLPVLHHAPHLPTALPCRTHHLPAPLSAAYTTTTALPCLRTCCHLPARTLATTRATAATTARIPRHALFAARCAPHAAPHTCAAYRTPPHYRLRTHACAPHAALAPACRTHYCLPLRTPLTRTPCTLLFIAAAATPPPLFPYHAPACSPSRAPSSTLPSAPANTCFCIVAARTLHRHTFAHYPAAAPASRRLAAFLYSHLASPQLSPPVLCTFAPPTPLTATLAAFSLRQHSRISNTCSYHRLSYNASLNS